MWVLPPAKETDLLSVEAFSVAALLDPLMTNIDPFDFGLHGCLTFRFAFSAVN